MPRLVDYAGRFEFLRRAAFAIVRDRGVRDLSRHAIAHELGTSVSTVRRLLDHEAQLVVLAVDEVTRRRRTGRWGTPPGSPEQVALALLRRALPDQPHRIAEELVWWRLVIAGPRRVPVADDGEGSLRTQFQVATYGYADPAAENDPHGAGMVEDAAADRLAPHIEAHDAGLEALIQRVLDLLGVPEPDRPREARRIRAVLDGLNVGVCLGRWTPEDAVAALADHLSTVRVAA